MSRLAGKVAFITGAARGQGRAHAVRLAREGADIIAVDLCAQLGSVAYAMSTPEDLAETVRLVEAEDRRIVARQADVRDEAALTGVVEEGVAAFGGLDIVVANAGIMPIIGDVGDSPAAWHDSIDVMLTGVYNTILAALPALRARGAGSIVITSSTAGLRGVVVSMDGMSRGNAGYHAAKFGVVGLMKLYANALGPENIRVNTVHPTGVRTPMVVNDEFTQYASDNSILVSAMSRRAMPIDMIEPEDVASAVAWLVSDDARWVTGVALPVDAGASFR